jgi:pimeloyl-ACP methyl ester carboxylesterase
MPYFERSNDLKLFYTVHGDPTKPPFLLVHGWTCDSTDWIFTIPALVQDYYVIAFDHRGHGHSSAPETISYTTRDMAADAVALLEHLGVTKKVLVMGHSMGGIVASALTGLYPDLFRGLVVLDPPYWRSTAFWVDMLPQWDEMQNGLMFVTKAFGNQISPNIPPWMLTWIGIRGAAMSEHAVGACLKGMFGPGMLGQMESHQELVKGRTIPRLAVYMKEENAELERGLGLGSLDRVTTILDAGHWFYHVKADEFNGLLKDWLATIEK